LPRTELSAPRVRIDGPSISAGADVFITGDKELLDLGRAESVQIVSPRQFWEKIQSEMKPRAVRHKRRL
jgi:hypothetical protein